MSDRSLGAIIMAVVELQASMREQGATQAAIDAAMETAVRASWPFAREWKYICRDCQDTGLVLQVCEPGHRCNGLSTRIDGPKEQASKYQRLCTKAETYVHDYSIPCWCKAGNRFRTQPASDADYTQAGKTSRPMTRWSQR